MTTCSATSGPVVCDSGSNRHPGFSTVRMPRCCLSLCSGNGETPSKLKQSAIHEAAHTVVATMIHPGMVAEVFISDSAVDVTGDWDELGDTFHGLTGGVRFHRMQTTVFENGLIAYSGFFAECEHLFRSGIDLEPLLPQLRHQISRASCNRRSVGE